MSGNKITSLNADLFKNSVELDWVELADNSFTDVHPSAFRNNSKLKQVDMSGNKISSIHPDSFIHNTAMEWLDLKVNNIIDVDPSAFQNNSYLIHLYTSRNKINSIHQTHLYISLHWDRFV